ncbi:hypothetical protein QYM36_007055 [Artemia franciscana]|uniref:Sm domain-containing protein n=1 Tax=Artemia franciscana TaxID=6661 RepID=A0AA88HV13_ARTSF|nr:hypothetical protein QYM36_007055 [Artemia franciscana]
MSAEVETTRIFPSAREKFKIISTLNCLVHSLQGQVTQIDLRDESSVVGKISFVDAEMNVNLENCTYLGSDKTTRIFEEFFIKSRLIRFVHIPKNVRCKLSIYMKYLG